jgi:hypothetical protein
LFSFRNEVSQSGHFFFQALDLGFDEFRHAMFDPVNLPGRDPESFGHLFRRPLKNPVDTID